MPLAVPMPGPTWQQGDVSIFSLLEAKGCQRLHTHLATCHLVVSSWVGVELEGHGHDRPAGHPAARPEEEHGQLDTMLKRFFVCITLIFLWQKTGWGHSPLL